MVQKLILDSGPLGRISHPKAEEKNKELTEWIKTLLKEGAQVFVPEISDYEVRRNLVLEGKQKSIEKLDLLGKALTYLPLTTDVMRQAAAFWAEVRKPPNPKPTADKHALDGDSILAAQAVSVEATIITDNIGHLERFSGVSVKRWNEL